ncbi:MAG TPA: YkgJ family cysteine cluster protein [Acidimicrobiales bacterium]
MTEDNMSGDPDLDAGVFSTWMTEMQAALGGQGTSDVPCDGCTACCTSSQFIHIAPDEADPLAHIPVELLFPAPRFPPGHVLLGYDHRGHCPMLIDDRCSIYPHRPRTCRTYDCRVFPAAGLDNDDKIQITRQARRWRFSYPTPADRAQRDSVRAAASYLDGHREQMSESVAPRDATQLAVLAVEMHDVFLRRDGESGQLAVADPDPEVVRVELTRRRGSHRPAPGVAGAEGNPGTTTTPGH